MNLKEVRAYVERKIKESDVWEGFDVDRFVESLEKIIRRYGVEEKVDLKAEVVDKLMVLYLVRGMLSDLDEEKLEEFDRVVRGCR